MSAVALGSPIEGTVLFKVKVDILPVGEGRWVCVGKQTGVVSHGDTKESVLERSAEMHRLLVKRLKRNGFLALTEFMNVRGISFDVTTEQGLDWQLFRETGASEHGTEREIEVRDTAPAAA